MHLQIASDLHLEFLKQRFPTERLIQPAAEADILILAGDICHGTDAIALFRDWPVPVLYLAGNHEFYKCDLQATRDSLRAAAQGTNVRFLDNDAMDIDGIRFLGTTLWTDYRLGADRTQEQLMAYAEPRINDHSLTRILTAVPVRILFSERRTPLSNPKGKGRSENVQPDFGIWHGPTSGDVCDLVVEVKHYLRPAKTSWTHVIEDYANAHPSATIVLVNYGQSGNAMDAVCSDAKSRCRLIGNLRPRQPSAIAELSDLVRRAVGPVFRVDQQGVRGGAETPLAVILDRSSSMGLDLDARIRIVRRQVDAFGASHVGVATFGANEYWLADDEGVDAAANIPSDSEARFTDILSIFLKKFPELVFVTDDDGSDYLDRDKLRVHEVTPALAGVRVLRVALRS